MPAGWSSRGSSSGRASFGGLRAVGRVELSRLRDEQLPSEAIFGRIIQLGSY